MVLQFRFASAHIGLFELPRTSVSGHHERTGAALDVGVTLAGSSDENLGLMTGMCARPLTALGYVSLGKATPLHFHKSFTSSRKFMEMCFPLFLRPCLGVLPKRHMKGTHLTY